MQIIHILEFVRYQIAKLIYPGKVFYHKSHKEIRCKTKRL
jgi:hypothetical protein